jgi:hypothetical protein
MILYKRNLALGKYYSDNAYILPDDFYSDGARKSDPIPESEIISVPPCPYCQSDGFAMCSFCNNLFCIDDEASRGQITCPACETNLSPSDDDSSFNFSGSVG